MCVCFESTTIKMVMDEESDGPLLCCCFSFIKSNGPYRVKDLLDLQLT